MIVDNCNSAVYNNIAEILDDPTWHERLPFDHVAFYLYGIWYERGVEAMRKAMLDKW